MTGVTITKVCLCDQCFCDRQKSMLLPEMVTGEIGVLISEEAQLEIDLINIAWLYLTVLLKGYGQIRPPYYMNPCLFKAIFSCPKCHRHS